MNSITKSNNGPPKKRKINTIFLGSLDEVSASTSSKAHEGNSLGGGSGMQEAQVISSDSQGESKKAKNDLLEAEDLRYDDNQDLVEIEFDYTIVSFTAPQLPSSNKIKRLELCPIQSIPSFSATEPGKPQILESPSAKSELTTEVKGTNNTNITFNVRNTLQGNIKHSMIVKKFGRKIFWRSTIDNQIVILQANARWLVLATQDFRVIICSTDTGALISTLCLDSIACKLTLKNGILVVLTANCVLYSWDLQRSSLIVKQSFAHLLRDPGSRISKIAISSEGIPLLILNNSEAFVFHKGFQCWLSLVLNQYRTKQLLNPLKFLKKLCPDGLISNLYAVIIQASSDKSNQLQFNLEQSSRFEEMQLELLIMGTRALNSAIEFRFLVSFYAHRLYENGLHKKLSEFITEICHSSHKQTCGINPEVLLKDLRSNNINVPNIIAKDKDNDLEDIDWSFVA